MTIEKNIPSKRIKSMHRAARKAGVHNSLRSFARALVIGRMPGHKTAREWLDGKRKPQTAKMPHVWRAA